MREMMALTFSSAPMMQMPKNLYLPLSIRDEEGTGDEEDLKGKVVVHIENGEDADYDESCSRWDEEYPVIRLSSFTRKATCLTAMI